MSYTPRHRNQHETWPGEPASYARSQYPYDDCWVKVIEWSADGATGGRVKSNPVTIRELVHKYSGNPNVDGAGSAQDVEAGMRALGIKYDVGELELATARQLIETRRPGLFIYVPTDFEKWPERHRCDPNFRGRHAVGVVPGRSVAGRVKIMDPVCHAYYWMSVNALLASMQLYAADHGLRPGTVYVGRNAGVPKAAPAPAPVPVGRVYALPLTGASLRHLPRKTANLLATVPYGGRLQVAGPSGATAPAAGTRSPVWLEVTGLGSLSLRPSAWVLTSDVTQAPPPPPTPPSNGTP